MLVSDSSEGSIYVAVDFMAAGVGERTEVGFEGMRIATDMLRHRQMI
jgi:hypothetical protein